MTHYYITVSRVTEEETETAVNEKLEDGWEQVSPVLPLHNVNSAWQPSRGKYTLDNYKGSYMTSKFACRMRKEKELVLKKDVRKRMATINKNHDALVEELLNELHEVEGKHRKALVRIANLEKSRNHKTKIVDDLTERNTRLSRTNSILDRENTELRLKVEELSKKASAAKIAPINGLYPAIIKVGKQWMLLDMYKTAEQAQQRVIAANKVL